VFLWWGSSNGEHGLKAEGKIRADPLI